MESKKNRCKCDILINLFALSLRLMRAGEPLKLPPNEDALCARHAIFILPARHATFLEFSEVEQLAKDQDGIYPNYVRQWRKRQWDAIHTMLGK